MQHGYANPILPGFYPDPSICRVGQVFYLVTSSFEYFPGVPIFESRDLVRWRQMGHCLDRASQLPLGRTACSLGIWAPTIRYHAGRFYMITTNTSVRRNFYVTTADPRGPWSEPVWLDEEGFDPSLLFDEDGQVYYTRKGCPAGPDSEGIYQARIDVESGRLLDTPRLVSKGTGGMAVEAPHLYRIGAWYYMLLAEGGTHMGHMVTIGRSRSPWGPFEWCPHNPILSHRDNGRSEIQMTGHGELVQDADGRWWMVFLGTRIYEYQHQHLGRETFLSPVHWNQEGWPVVGENGTTDLWVETPLPAESPWPDEPSRDDFNSPDLRHCWNWLRNPARENYDLRTRPGFLRLHGTAVGLDDADSPTFLGRRLQHFCATMTARLEFDPSREGEEAGLTLLMNTHHHYDIAVVREGAARQVVVRRTIGDMQVIAAKRSLAEGPVLLRVVADRTTFHFETSQDGVRFERMASAWARYLSQQVAGGFTGVYVGLYATGHGSLCQEPADFDSFEYEPARPPPLSN
jgi:xylan 1,4-beta-xylosidase